MPPTDPTPTPTPWPYPPETGRTHYDGCWRERGHHNCAVARVERVEAERDALRARVAAQGRVLSAIGKWTERAAPDFGSDDPDDSISRPRVWDWAWRAAKKSVCAILGPVPTPSRPTDTGRDG